jgi:hypothetical protein
MYAITYRKSASGEFIYLAGLLCQHLIRMFPPVTIALTFSNSA